MSAALQSQIDQKTLSGELRTQKQVDQQPATAGASWSLPSFFTYLKDNQAVTAPFPGAQQPNGGWFDQASKAIGGTEGFEGRAYHGAYSPLRKPGAPFVKPGEVVPGMKSEVSIGYGYNLTGNTDSRQVFSKVLGIGDKQFDDILNGSAEITPAQGEKLREYTIRQMNGYLDHYVKAPLTDYQRAALVSMVYNFGPGSFNKTGIPDAINSGKSPQEVAQMIVNASPAQPKLKGRRQAEAQLFLGVNDGASLVANTTTNYTKPQGT